MSDAKVETNAAEQAPQTHENKLPGIGAFIAFILAVIMFSGVFAKMPDAYKWLSALDFSTLVGKFGTIVDKANLVGHGGNGARGGFLFGDSASQAAPWSAWSDGSCPDYRPSVD